ncbi:hypothetical protein [Fluviicola taffensis]|uniref:hypothetical protein n=1 Tax=Fluviicola taffensis TaxID=191579 RepID=UPI0031381FED
MPYLKRIFHSIFGKNYESVWRKFANENNGSYVVGIGHHYDSVEIAYSNHQIIFDQYTLYQVVGHSSYTRDYTRVRLEFRSPDNLQFRLTKQYLVDVIGKVFGAQDIQIGDKSFDWRFLVKGNDEFKVQTLFSNELVKRLILAHDDIHLQLMDQEGVFDEPIQEGCSMLYYLSETVVKNIDQLYALLELYKAVIDQLTKLGSVKPMMTQNQSG